MIPRSDAEGLEIVPQHSDLEYNGPSTSHHAYEALQKADAPYNEHDFNSTPNAEWFVSELHHDPSEKRTCGLRRRTVWLIAGLLTLAVLAAAIGGGIGGSLANRSKQNTTTSPIAQASASSSGAPTGAISSTGTTPPTSTLQTPTSTSTIIGPSATLLRDCPSSNNTIYTAQLGSAKQRYRKVCSTVFDSTKSASDNFVDQFAASLNDCIGLCAQWNVNDHKSTSGLPQTCGAVCWRNNFQNDHPGTCYGYAVSNSSDGTFRTEPDKDCDSAVWMDAP